jgi:hypothetical protein
MTRELSAGGDRRFAGHFNACSTGRPEFALGEPLDRIGRQAIARADDRRWTSCTSEGAVLYGAVLPVLAELRAVPRLPTAHGTTYLVEGTIPAARVHELQQRLPPLTSGEGVLETEFDRYQAVVHGPAPTRPRTDADHLDRRAYLHRLGSSGWRACRSPSASRRARTPCRGCDPRFAVRCRPGGPTLTLGRTVGRGPGRRRPPC